MSIGGITVAGMSSISGGHGMLPPPSLTLSNISSAPGPSTVGEMGPPRPPDPGENTPGGQQAVLQQAQ